MWRMKSEVKKVFDMAKKNCTQENFAPVGLTHFSGLIKTRPGTMEGAFQ